MSEYLDQLDAAALGLLAEATGLTSRTEAPRFFAEQPNGIRIALGSPEAAALLESRDLLSGSNAHRLLRIAIGVHRTAEEICSAGWTAEDTSPLDVPLLHFAGQGSNHALLIDLLASFLPTEVPEGIGFDLGPTTAPGTLDRVRELITLCNEVGETERAGALRLLGDDALFTAGVRPADAARVNLDHETRELLPTVLPRAVRELLPDLDPQLRTLLDVHLMFGPIWYRMAAQNLLQTGMRGPLSDLARDFTLARRFLVRVAQGPLARLRDDIFAVTV